MKLSDRLAAAQRKASDEATDVTRNRIVHAVSEPVDVPAAEDDPIEPSTGSAHLVAVNDGDDMAEPDPEVDGDGGMPPTRALLTPPEVGHAAVRRPARDHQALSAPGAAHRPRPDSVRRPRSTSRNSRSVFARRCTTSWKPSRPSSATASVSASRTRSPTRSSATARWSRSCATVRVTEIMVNGSQQIYIERAGADPPSRRCVHRRSAPAPHDRQDRRWGRAPRR